MAHSKRWGDQPARRRVMHCGRQGEGPRPMGEELARRRVVCGKWRGKGYGRWERSWLEGREKDRDRQERSWQGEGCSLPPGGQSKSLPTSRASSIKLALGSRALLFPLCLAHLLAASLPCALSISIPSTSSSASPPPLPHQPPVAPTANTHHLGARVAALSIKSSTSLHDLASRAALGILLRMTSTSTTAPTSASHDFDVASSELTCAILMHFLHNHNICSASS
uniref:Uncharacterized protein n=1 Tax=Oryza sativa subsp. japonica TaxID=39947 RepID=Q69TF2_ORYSJ|nr:hypothetical protein [Oryza sativa Japonica Group]